MSDELNELLELAEKVTTHTDDVEESTGGARPPKKKKTKDEEPPAWGKKKREELVIMLMNDVVRKLNEIKYVAASPVIQKDVDEIYKDLKVLYVLLFE